MDSRLVLDIMQEYYEDRIGGELGRVCMGLWFAL